MKSNKMQIIKQHEEMLDIIKNKEFDKIDTYINKHIVEPASKWETLINENEELKAFFK
ncbi:transcriptional regulator domain protein [[Clostridium] sordellii ATCC 9714]|nr:transcriptional regulator domain protein [[Clostridium] sordellii ATCC 9714] [Paeniclostridium sordellii ATCC 9714]